MDDYNDLIEYFAVKKLNGTDYTTIRNELKQKNLSEDIIKRIISDIDDIVINEEHNKITLRKRKEFYYTGLVLTLVGLVITVGTYTGWINSGDSYFIVYGPFLAGISLMGYARRFKPQDRPAKNLYFNRKSNKR